MSFPQQQQQIQPQQQQPQQQQQPVQVYPNTVNQQPSQHHSNGSFGTVFIVLAVIVVISAIACFLGRLCNRRMQQPKAKQNHSSRHKESRPKDQDIEFGFEMSRPIRPKDRGIEFGFDKKFPTGKPVVGNGETRGFKPHQNGEFKGETRGHQNGEFKGETRGFKPHQNGEFKGEFRPQSADDGEFRAGA